MNALIEKNLNENFREGSFTINIYKKIIFLEFPYPA